MQIPRNTLRDALAAGRAQIGLWVGLADANAAEALAGCGFDWLLLDGEHAPNDVRTMLDQLRAVAPYPVHPVVRPVHGEVALIKQLLDIGAQTVLVPVEGIATVRAAGKAPGVLMADRALAQRYLDAGALFVAVGVDTTLLVRSATELARHFKPAPAVPTAPAGNGPY